ncbi:DUF1992 domain-containing protein [Microlunatus aurantiacus]|uniref:DUF1992 domain-containing protein n=1 Tax=Microlunatus aurantiacus TaxID=446786 RepID=A0ABP7DH56_9ACTN
MTGYESWVDRQIREAQERGEFDNLRGSGEPLKGLGGRPDENWWVKGLLERENLRPPLPGSLLLRKEVAEIGELVADCTSEAQVREIAQDLHHRILTSRRRGIDGPRIVIPDVDVERVVREWREARSAS